MAQGVQGAVHTRGRYAIEALIFDVCSACGKILKDPNGSYYNNEKKCSCYKAGGKERLGKPHHFTIYSDLHDDAKASNRDKMLKHMSARSSLERSHFMLIGDAGNWVVPSDTKRFMASVPRGELSGIDDYVDQHIDEQVDMYKKYPFRFVGLGNHCYQMLKRHHTNPMMRLARQLHVPYAGYSGLARFRFVDGNCRGPRCTFTVLYHHGAWGGRVMKGYGGARDFAKHFDGWDVFAYGHNHHCNLHHEAKVRMTAGGKLVTRSVYFVNTGTFYDGVTNQGELDYGEVRGYGPVALAAPLITATPTKNGVKISVTTGDP